MADNKPLCQNKVELSIVLTGCLFFVVIATISTLKFMANKEISHRDLMAIGGIEDAPSLERLGIYGWH